MQPPEKHRSISEIAPQSVLSVVSKLHGSHDVQPAPRPANQALWANHPITEAEKTFAAAYSRQVQLLFSKYFYLLRSETGGLWAAGNPELTAFVRKLWALQSASELQAVAA